MPATINPFAPITAPAAEPVQAQPEAVNESIINPFSPISPGGLEPSGGNAPSSPSVSAPPRVDAEISLFKNTAPPQQVEASPAQNPLGGNFSSRDSAVAPDVVAGDPVPAPPLEGGMESPSVGDHLRNAGISLLQGAMRFAQTPFSVGSMLGNLVDEDFSQTGPGQFFGGASDFFNTGISEAEQLQPETVQAAKDAPVFDPRTGDIIPSNINASKIISTIGQAAPQIPLFLATGGAGQGAGLAAKAGQVARIGATGAAVGGAQVFEETRQEAQRILSEQRKPDGTPLYDEGQIEKISQTAASEAGARSMPVSAVLTAAGLIGPLSGVGKSTVGRIFKGAFTDAPAEGIEEGLQTFEKNLTLKEKGIDPNRDLKKDVGESAVLGAVAGAAIGGGSAAFSGKGGGKTKPDTDTKSKPDQRQAESKQEETKSKTAERENESKSREQENKETAPEPGKAKVTTDPEGQKTVEISLVKNTKKTEVEAPKQEPPPEPNAEAQPQQGVDVNKKREAFGDETKGGEKSNLTARQQNKVRSVAFKRWFGDWENDPQNASKVVDENGEPLVVFHGTDQEFEAFDPEKTIGGQFWFTSDKGAIERGEVGAQGKGVIVPAFLSIKKPAGWKEYDNLTLDELIARGYDGLILPDKDETTYVAFSPEQIKSVNNRGTFDPNDPKILGDAVSDFEPNQKSTLPGKKTLGDSGDTEVLSQIKPGIDPDVKRETSLVYQPPEDTPEALQKKFRGMLDRIGKTVAKGKARPDVIRKLIREKLGVPFNEGGFRVAGRKGGSIRLGQFKIKPRTIQLANKNNIDTLAHEVGHHFSETNKEVRALFFKHQDEILGLTPSVYAREGKALKLEEGFAEFFRIYFTNRQTAKLKAPEFFGDFQEFLIKTPDYRTIMEEFSTMVADWQGLTPNDRIMAKVGRPPWWTELSSINAKSLTDWWTLKAISRKDPLVRMVQELDPSLESAKDPAKLYQLGYGDSGLVETWIETGRVPYNFEERLDPDKWEKSLKDILDPVVKADMIEDLTTYLIARRADELKKFDKENLFSVEEIDAKIKEVESMPEEKRQLIEKAAEEIYEYNRALTQYAVDGGFLSPEVAEKFQVYSSYIPFFRVKEGGGEVKSGSLKNPFKRLRGGTDNINDPIENMLQNTTNIIYATNRNNILRQTLSVAAKTPGGGKWAESWPMPMQAVQVQTEAIIQNFARDGINVDWQIGTVLNEIQTFFQPKPVDDPGNHILIYREDGKPKAMKINDPFLLETLTSFSTRRMPVIDAIARPVARVKRATVVLDLAFMARNFVRDTTSAYIQSTTKKNFIPVKDSIAGAKEVLSKSVTAKMFKAMGGGGANVFRTDSTGTIESSRKKLADIGGFDAKTIIFPWELVPKLLDKMERAGAAVENSARVREFKQTFKEKGGDANAAVDAAIAAREISVDFGDIGTSAAIQALARSTPFFNARVQGWAKTKRTFFGKNAKQAWLRGMLGMTIPALTIALINRMNGNFDDLEDWERNVYLHFKIDGDEYRIPKPWEYGAVFMTLPERFLNWTIDSIEGKADREEFMRGVGSTLLDSVGGWPVPTVLGVPIELWANKSFFLGRDIENFAQQRQSPGFRYYDHTSETLKAVGELLDVSPLKMEHAVRGYFSGLGMLTLSGMDSMISVVENKPVTEPAQTLRDWPVFKIFAPNPDKKHSKAINDFYENYKRIMEAEADYRKIEKEDDMEKLERQLQKRPEMDAGLGKTARRVARTFSDIRAEISQIRRAPDSQFRGMSTNQIANEKAKQIAALKREMRDLAKETNADIKEELRLLEER